MALAESMPEPTPGLARALRRFTVSEYHRLIDLGILSEEDRVELLEGLLVQKMVRKPRHDAAVSLVHSALAAELPSVYFCRVQSAVTTADSEPELDVAVVSGSPRQYLDHHPGPNDIALVVEVAEGSLERDRGDKARLYARAGIPRYWIVNLVGDSVETFEEPLGDQYRACSTLRRGESVRLAVGDATLEIRVADLLP